jgi:AraC-like DNA-binding protein
MNEIIYAGKHLITFSVSRHAHNSWEFIYCTGGSGRIIFDDNAIVYKAGDVVLIPPLLYHQNESETGFTNIHLNVRDPALNLRRPTVIHDDGNHFILDAFTAAFYYFGSNPGKQTLLLSAYANLIVSLISNCLSMPVRNPIVEEIAKNIILSYPDENFELDQYLRTLPFNYDYLRKLFKHEAGVTPHQFLVDTRLQAAAERLAGSEGRVVNISDAAHLCGFREPLYFSKVFRKKYGMSPTQYQSQAAATTANVPDSESIKIRPEGGA